MDPQSSKTINTNLSNRHVFIDLQS